MPLHVYVNLNRKGTPLDRVHIARIDGGEDPEDVNTYVVVSGTEPFYLSEWMDRGVTYKHRYGDGALICVRKGLEALEKRDAPTELKIDLSRGGHICDYTFEIWKPTAVCGCGAVAANPLYIRNRNEL